MTITVRTAAGLADLIEPEAIRDPFLPAPLARSLANQARFAGAFPADDLWWSVAHHSVACARVARRAHPMDPLVWGVALLHDAHEAVIGDVIRPVRALIDRIAGGGAGWALDELADVLDHAVADLYGLPSPGAPEWLLADEIDDAMLAAEHLCIWGPDAPPPPAAPADPDAELVDSAAQAVCDMRITGDRRRAIEIFRAELLAMELAGALKLPGAG